MTERDFAINVVRTLQAAGHQAVFAGGCVRDQLLGLEPADYDVATDATPETVQKQFRRTLAVGASFGVIEVLGPKLDGEWLKVQVATFRSDGTYSDGRRPDAVTFSSAEEDAQRRDFTINGLFYDPVADQLLDYVGGRADLQAKLLRAIGDPQARFREDKLRMLRAVRIAARFGLAVDAATLDAARAMVPQISVVSPERIADELRKLLAAPTRGRGVALLSEFGLVEPILPESVDAFDSWHEIVNALPGRATFEVALAAIVPTADGLGRRLKLSNDERQRIEWLVAHRDALADCASMSKCKLYPILAQPGARELVDLNRARGHVGADLAAQLLASTPPEVLDPPPLLTGDDLVASGWRPGREFKLILQSVRDAQLDGELINRDDAFILATRLRGNLSQVEP